MRTLVIGGGLIGLTTAWALAERGHDIILVDRREATGLETSFANGTLLTPSMSEPWNTPDCWRVLLASLVRSDSPLQIQLSALPGMTSWGLSFLRNSAPAIFAESTRRNVRLALYSLRETQSIRDALGLNYRQTTRGTLRLFRDARALDAAVWHAEKMSAEGVKSEAMTPDQTRRLEPRLAPTADQLAGAIHYPDDETGDAYLFCKALSDGLVQRGVEIRCDQHVRLTRSRAGVRALDSARQPIAADHIVVAAGSYSTPLLRAVGIHLPVRPAKGYSITLPQDQTDTPLRTPIVDDALHAVVAPLGGALRVAGTAEFAGFDLTLRPERIHNLLRLVQRILPDVRCDPDLVRPWCGLRAMSCDGVPLIGGAGTQGVWVNTGHGHLGWTMAVGSALMLADLIDGARPAIEAAPYAPQRFT